MGKNSIPLIKRIIFSPLAWIWELVYFCRRAFYDYGIFLQRSFQVPVISIGNLTFGGTGKTPFTLWLAEYLHQKNKKVMILTRGYKGKLENSRGIIHSGKKMVPDSIDYGDEALIFARRLVDATVVVGKKRSDNLSFYFPKIEPDVVLLDDGHQHIRLKRKLNIVLFDATMPLSSYHVAPLGYMREGFRGLKDADIIVIGKADIAGEKKVQALRSLLSSYVSVAVPFAEVAFRPNGFYNAANNLVMRPEQIKGRKVICLAGIANPESFFKLLESLGAEVIVTESFPDHHYFKLDEINALLAYAKSEDALLVTTEKDIVRIKKIIEDDAIVFLEVEIHFMCGEEATKNIIDSCINKIY